MRTWTPQNRFAKGGHYFGYKTTGWRADQSSTHEKGTHPGRTAEVVGINPKYLSGIERGRENPTFNTLISLANSLEVDFKEMFDLLEGEDPDHDKEYVRGFT